MWLLLFIQLVVIAIRRQLLRKQASRNDGALEFPVVEEGKPIPLVFGTQEIAPHVTWYGHLGKSGGDHPWWYARLQGVLCWGPVDVLHSINFDKRPAAMSHTPLGGGPYYRADATDEAYTRIDVMDPTLFGGPDQEGGVAGPITLWWGNPGPTGIGVQASAVLPAVFDDDYDPDGAGEVPPVDYAPRYPGLCHIVFGIGTGDLPTFAFGSIDRFGWAQNSPYAKPLTVLISRFPNPPELELTAAPPLTPSIDSDVNIGGDCNPAAALYELLTDDRAGAGLPSTRISTASFQAAAATLVTEAFGLSFVLHEPQGANEAMEEVLQHIDGLFRENPRTGLVELKLLREDYDLPTAPLVNDQNAWDMEISRSMWPETFNEVRVRYRELQNTADRKGFVDAAVTAQNLANWQATGTVRNDDAEFSMITKASLATLIAQRRLRVTSTLLAKATWKMNREGFDLMRGDVVRLAWPSAGVSLLAMRIIAIDYGNADDRSLSVEAVEDVFGVESAIYVAPPPTGWTSPVVEDVVGVPVTP